MQENYKILVVDDDMRLRALLERYLTGQGFEVRSVANAEQMDRLLTRESFHLMVLDLMLPGEDGLSICRRLRSQSNPMPIIMVTAKGEEVDRIVGLEIGADDYIPKPFNPRELLARIRAVLRRQANELPGAPSQEEAVIAFGKFKLNLGTREMFREDEPMPLTSGEFAVLKALVSHPREPLSRDKLMNWRAVANTPQWNAPSTCRSPVCAAWWKKIRRILVIFRPCGVWATCSSRTALKHEANALRREARLPAPCY